MPCSPSFVEHTLDLLSGVGPVQARRMFGGYGVYHRGAMIGLLDDDELFLKTDEETRPRFLEAGCRNWTYGKMEQTRYFRPPDEAHEDPEAMLPWALLAVEATARAEAVKAAKAARLAARRAEAEGAKKPAARRPGARKPGVKKAAPHKGPARAAVRARPSPRRRQSR